MDKTKKLGQLSATAISGNDITSSCLYVSAISIAFAGQYAWIALLIVSAVLFLFRKIYGEVVGALPLNGGAYNVLLNTSSKLNASVAAGLTILSYMATAVISANEAMHYLYSLVPVFPVMLATILLLCIFLILTIIGISESAFVARVIFIAHISAMILLIGSGIWFVARNGLGTLIDNFHLPVKGSITLALFFGFSTAMLGISGFESSANFVEEQKHGVFPKTLRNMWIAVTFINPLIAFIAIAVMPVSEINSNQEALLSHMGTVSGGKWLSSIISIDATFVLSGAVLTSFIGVSGLMKRLTLDRILPQFLLKETRHKSNPRIAILFFLLCLSILSITNGKLEALAGMYTISFLSVMIFFGIGNLMLKIKRSRLPRPEYAPYLSVIIAILALLIGIYGNIKLHPEYLVIFLQYFIPTFLILYLLLNRKYLIQFLLLISKSFFDSIFRIAMITNDKLTNKLQKLIGQQFIYFTKGDDIISLNKVMIYVIENEITRKLKIVKVLKPGELISNEFESDIKLLDKIYPELDVEFVQFDGEFGPELIRKLSKEWSIPSNFMFISSPGDKFPFRIADLEGVRLIM
ncbi:MAG: APC family permease [Bacteroidales bacterium]